MPVLDIRSICKTISGRKILDQISFTVDSGEIVGFLGPNGSGKTTTIKMIMGLLSIDEGEIFINGCSVKKEFEKALCRVGGIIENPEMYGHLSGWTNLKMFANMHGNISEETIEETVRMVHLEDRISDKVRRYSLGMRQRLGVAQAVLHEPNLLILDEPTNGLDPEGIKELRDTLRSFAEKGAGVLVSSHLLAEMQLMCDRVCIIEKGRLIAKQSLRDLTEVQAGELLSYHFDVGEPEHFVQLLRQMPAPEPRMEGSSVVLPATREKAAELVRLLVEHQIPVYGLYPEQKSLETAYLEVTKGLSHMVGTEGGQ